MTKAEQSMSRLPLLDELELPDCAWFFRYFKVTMRGTWLMVNSTSNGMSKEWFCAEMYTRWSTSFIPTDSNSGPNSYNNWFMSVGYAAWSVSVFVCISCTSCNNVLEVEEEEDDEERSVSHLKWLLVESFQCIEEIFRIVFGRCRQFVSDLLTEQLHLSHFQEITAQCWPSIRTFGDGIGVDTIRLS